jgi:hypothetical protein
MELGLVLLVPLTLLLGPAVAIDIGSNSQTGRGRGFTVQTNLPSINVSIIVQFCHPTCLRWV